MSIGREMRKEGMVHVYRGILISHKKRNKIMPFAATWIRLEIIIVHEVRKRKDKYRTILLICEI